MIPFTIPEDTFLLNMNHVVSILEFPRSQFATAAKPETVRIEVQLSTGEVLNFEGRPAEIIKAEAVFCYQHHAAVKASIINAQAAANQSIIVPKMSTDGLH